MAEKGREETKTLSHCGNPGELVAAMGKPSSFGRVGNHQNSAGVPEITVLIRARLRGSLQRRRHWPGGGGAPRRRRAIRTRPKRKRSLNFSVSSRLRLVPLFAIINSRRDVLLLRRTRISYRNLK